MERVIIRKIVLAGMAMILVAAAAFTGKSLYAAESAELPNATVSSPKSDPLRSPDQSGDPLSLPPLTAIPAEQQIQLALSAAPPEISQHATVYVLGSKGYVKARTGTNGFTCLVERQFPETVEPLCYDAEGSATTLQARLYREELRAEGIPEEEVQKKIDAGYKAGKFIAPKKTGLAYMLSTQAKVYDPFLKKITQATPHLMFYAPYATSKDMGGFWGVNMPFVLWEGQPDTFIIVIPSLMSATAQQPASDTGIK